MCRLEYVVVIDLPLLRVAVEGSDNPVSLEKPCQASLPPDQQGRHSLGRHPDSMSPARSRRSASHAAGTHGWLPQKTGRPGLRRGGVGGYNLHSVPPNSPPDCGTVAHQPRAGCIRLEYHHHHRVTKLFAFIALCMRFLFH